MFFSREILVAFAVGVVLIAGSFYVRASDETIEGTVTAITPPPPERTYIETPDSDGDGISDWAEELLRDREVVSAAAIPAEDYVPPETLTGLFSIKFFQDYLLQKGLGEFGESKEELAERAIETLKREARDTVYTIDDISISLDDSTGAKHAYGNKIAEILFTDEVETQLDEISILERALDTNSPERLADLDPIIEAYARYFEETKAVPVPPSLVRQHIDLINVYHAVHKDLVAMRAMFEDPLLGTLRLKRYQDDIEGMVYVLYNIDRVLRREGVTYQDDEFGATFALLGQLRQEIQ